jgi:hypothetical protein
MVEVIVLRNSDKCWFSELYGHMLKTTCLVPVHKYRCTTGMKNVTVVIEKLVGSPV